MFKPALLYVCLLVGSLSAQQRQFKTQAEYDAYNDVAKDLTANNPHKALADLDAWKQKFPDSEFKDDRTALYVQAWARANQPANAVDAAADLMGKNLSPSVLYTIAMAIQRVPEPSADQLSIGAQAARKLASYEKAPEGVTAEAWAQAKRDMQAAAKSAMLYVELVPSAQALKRKDCEAAESVARRALQDFPASGQAAWSLGSALICLKKPTAAIYHFARAASLDPQTAMVDPKWQQSTALLYLERVYEQFHGADPEGLNQLKALAVTSPLPPDGFVLKSAAEIASEKQAVFQRDHPELALWMTIKAELDAKGDEYFNSDLKDTKVPPLAGSLVEAKPACRPNELVVAVDEARVVLKLEKALTGKPDLPADIKWTGVPTAFSSKPFLLTMSVDTAEVEGLKVTPCARK